MEMYRITYTMEGSVDIEALSEDEAVEAFASVSESELCENILIGTATIESVSEK